VVSLPGAPVNVMKSCHTLMCIPESHLPGDVEAAMMR
jgi:hypothetical protein